MDHDRLFKELLTAFFFEFLELFFPTLATLVDRSQEPEFLDTQGETNQESTRIADLMVRLRLLEGEACFIVHLEHEAQDKGSVPARMYRYFSRAWDRYQLPVYPIAILSFPGLKPEPQSYSLKFHDRPMLDFRYRTVQLNQLNWSDFLNNPNPLASALMARMKIRKCDRPQVKVECLRLLATLRLDREKSKLISRFVDSYLRMTAREMRVYEEILETIPPGERQVVMQYTTSWKEEGRREGREEGLQEGLAKASRRD